MMDDEPRRVGGGVGGGVFEGLAGPSSRSSAPRHPPSENRASSIPRALGAPVVGLVVRTHERFAFDGRAVLLARLSVSEPMPGDNKRAAVFAAATLPQQLSSSPSLILLLEHDATVMLVRLVAVELWAMASENATPRKF